MAHQPRTFEVPPLPIRFGVWSPVSTDSPVKLKRTRQVWVDGNAVPVANQYRVDYQNSDQWIEWSVFTPTYWRSDVGSSLSTYKEKVATFKLRRGGKKKRLDTAATPE